MARTPRSTKFRERAEAALLAALELYNKPHFSYREEAFAILLLNAWELLLKARLVQLHGNDLRCLYVYDHKEKRDGSRSKRQYIRRNRSRNAYTIGITNCVDRLRDVESAVPLPVARNIDALMEIRDNAVHFVVISPSLVETVRAVGTASVMNFIELSRTWFGETLSMHDLQVMPIGIIDTTPVAVLKSSDEENLLSYLEQLAASPSAHSDEYHVSVRLDVRIRRSAQSTIGLGVTDDPVPGTLVVQMREEDIRLQYPWDYHELVDRMRRRYSDFKENRTFHELRKPLMGVESLVTSRYLDPGNPRSPKKDFYSPNILRRFDSAYTRR